MTIPPMQVVSKATLRQMFNDGRYWERALAGELTQSLKKDHHPDIPLAGEPPCTRSQFITYTDLLGNKIGVHQYLRPDKKTLGLSGRPEPKYMLLNGVLYVTLEHRQKQLKT